jgi:hypothetical protein
MATAADTDALSKHILLEEQRFGLGAGQEAGRR